MWFWLFAAILCEVVGTTSLKLSEGFSKLIPSITTGLFYSLSFYSLSLALKNMDIGIAYSIWSGLGTAIVAIIGVYLFGESLSALKILSIMLIIIGVVGLNLSLQ